MAGVQWRLDGANLRGARLQEVEWTGAVLIGANLRRTHVDVRKIPGVIVTPSDWFSYALDPKAELMLLEPALRQQAIWRRLDFLRWLVRSGRIQR